MFNGMSLSDLRALVARLEEEEAEAEAEKQLERERQAAEAARQAAKAAAEVKRRVVEEGRQAAVLKKREDAKRQMESRAKGKGKAGSTAQGSTTAANKPRNDKKRVRGESDDDGDDDDLMKCKRCTTLGADCAWAAGKSCGACLSAKVKCDGATWPKGVGARKNPPRKAKVTKKTRLVESDDDEEDDEEDELVGDRDFWTQLHEADRESCRAGLDALTKVVGRLAAVVEAMAARGAGRRGEVEKKEMKLEVLKKD